MSETQWKKFQKKKNIFHAFFFRSWLSNEQAMNSAGIKRCTEQRLQSKIRVLLPAMVAVSKLLGDLSSRSLRTGEYRVEKGCLKGLTK